MRKWGVTVVLITSIAGVSLLAEAAEPLDTSILQAESARANQQVINRAIAPVQLTAYSSQTSMTPLPKEEPSFEIHHIVVTSKDAHFGYLSHALSAYENQRIGQQGVELLTKKLQERVINDGYVTSRVVVPNQDMTSGTLTFEVIPGYIEDIKLKDPTARGNWRATFPTRPHELVKRQNLEQGVDQMKSVPGQDVTISLEPGSTDNQSILVLDVKQHGYVHGGFSVDNGGYEDTGKVQGTAYISISQLAGLQDSLTASYTKDLEHQDSVYGSSQYNVSYRLPQGNTTYTFNTYKYNYHQTVATITPFLSEGTTRGMEFGIEQLINRTSRTKTTGIAKIIRKERHSFINGEELGVQEQYTTALELGLSHRKYKGNAAFDVYAFYRQGVPWLHAKQQDWEGIGDNPTSRYHMLGLEGQIQSRIRIGHKNGVYTMRFRSQFTADRLLGTDQFSIGGRYSVRGFSGEKVLRGESGYYIQNEWALPFEKEDITPYIGIDIGHVWGPSTEWQVGNTLMGGVLGVRGHLFHHVSYDVFIGTPLKQPKGFNADKRVWGFTFGYQW